MVLLKSMDDLIVSGLRIDWNMLTDSYVSRIPSLRSIDELEFHKNVTFLVGENGSGKSTLLEGIASTRKAARATTVSAHTMTRRISPRR